MEIKTIILICCLLVATVSTTALFVLMARKTGKSKRKEKPATDGYGGAGVGRRPLPRAEHLLSDSVGTGDEFDDIIARLELYFESKKPFRNPEIRISDVADELSVSKSTLSKAIRLKTGKNFCQIVHHYRVKEAMRLYAANPKLTISQLYKMVGFNSKTTFNTAFGRNTGCTPAEWCKNFRKGNGTVL